MTSGRRKPHHTHEIHDAYAEGWDARLRWRPGAPRPLNPYTLVTDVQLRKQSAPRRAVQNRDLTLWQSGWDDCCHDVDHGDLPEVTEADFKRAPIIGREPGEDEAPEDSDDED